MLKQPIVSSFAPMFELLQNVIFFKFLYRRHCNFANALLDGFPHRIVERVNIAIYTYSLMSVSSFLCLFWLITVEAHPLHTSKNLDIRQNANLDQSWIGSAVDSDISNAFPQNPDHSGFSSTPSDSSTQIGMTQYLPQQSGNHAKDSVINVNTLKASSKIPGFMDSEASPIPVTPNDQLGFNGEEELVDNPNSGSPIIVQEQDDPQKLAIQPYLMREGVGDGGTSDYPDLPEVPIGSKVASGGASCPSTGYSPEPQHPESSTGGRPQEGSSADEDGPEKATPPDCSRMGGNPRTAFCCKKGAPTRGFSRNQMLREAWPAFTRRGDCQPCKFFDTSVDMMKTLQSMLVEINLFLIFCARRVRPPVMLEALKCPMRFLQRRC